MGATFGAPSITGPVSFASLRLTVAVWGMLLAMCASRPEASRHRGLHVLLGAVVGDPGEVRRELPPGTYAHGPAHPRRAEPPPRDEDVDHLVLQVSEDVAGGVLDVEELSSADGGVVRLPLRHDELGGRRRHVDPGHRALGERGSRFRVLRIAALEEVDAPALRGRLQRRREIRDRGSRGRPRALERGRLHPAVEDVQVVRAGRRPKEERMGVDDPLEARARHGPVGGRPVDGDQDGRHRREDDHGRTVARLASPRPSAPPGGCPGPPRDGRVRSPSRAAPPVRSSGRRRLACRGTRESQPG